MDTEQARQIDELSQQLSIITKSATLDRSTKTALTNAILVALAKLAEAIIGPAGSDDSSQPGMSPDEIGRLLGPEAGRLAEAAQQHKADLAASDMKRMAEDLTAPLVEKLERLEAQNAELRRQVAEKEQIEAAKAGLEPVKTSSNGHHKPRPYRNIY